jgi:hypothetical protein
MIRMMTACDSVRIHMCVRETDRESYTVSRGVVGALWPSTLLAVSDKGDLVDLSFKGSRSGLAHCLQ